MNSTDERSPENPLATTIRQRVVSIDALRGFDMFWIIGADSLVAGLRAVSDSGVIRIAADQLEHVDWVGFHFYDLIFPLFVFLMGTASVFSLDRHLQASGQGRTAAYSRLLRRSLLIYLLGLFYYGARSSGTAAPRCFGMSVCCKESPSAICWVAWFI